MRSGLVLNAVIVVRYYLHAFVSILMMTRGLAIFMRIGLNAVEFRH